MANETMTLRPDFRVDVNELGRLFSRSAATIKFWTEKKGLVRQPDGSYNLRSSIFWLEKYYRNSAKPEVKFDSLEQQRLADLLGVTRQTLAAWTRAGLPRRSDRLYNIRDACKWLAQQHPKIAERKYQLRLSNIRKKLRRNLAQCERFFNKEILL